MLIRCDRLGHHDTVHLRHLHIEDHDLEWILLIRHTERFDRFMTGLVGLRAEPPVGQRFGVNLAVRLVIIEDDGPHPVKIAMEDGSGFVVLVTNAGTECEPEL